MSSKVRSALIVILSIFMIGPMLVIPLESEDAAAAAPSPTKWRRYASNPVLAPGASGAWDSDSSQFYVGCVLRDGSEYKMYYQGYDGSRYKIGLATSTDGVTFTKYASNPILSTGASGSWESKVLGGPTVLKIGDTYKMWYHGGDGSRTKIGYATSSDGKSWTKYASNPVMGNGGPADFDVYHLAFPCVLYENDTYRMWYTGYDTSNSRIGYATSSDGLCWTKYAGNPVLEVSPNGNWDDNHLAASAVVNVSGEYRMWYGGDSNSHWGTGYATSSDGTSWKKYDKNPVLPATGNGWEAHDAFMPAVVFNGSAYQMWYVGVSNSWVQQIGYAEGWNRIPNPPSLVAPADNSWFTTNTPTFCWTFSDVDDLDVQTAFQIELDNDSGFGSPEFDSGKIESSKDYYQPITGLPEGTFHWRARVWDTDGDNSTWSSSRLIKIDTMPPEQLSLTIDGGADYTSNRYVNLTVVATDPSPGSGLAYMSFSNDGSVWASWEAFKADRPGWDLTDSRYGGIGADGLKKVFLKVRDVAGNEVVPGNRANDTTFLDRAAPDQLGLTINSGDAYTNSSDVTLAPRASDPEPASGLWHMAFSNDGSAYSDWMDWKETALWSLTAGPGGESSDGDKQVWFKVQDRAGNGAGPVKAGIFLDRQSPEGLAIMIDKGAEYTNTTTAELAISAEDPEPASAVSDMTLANSENALGSWEAFATARGDWSLIAGPGGTDEDGNKTVYLKVKDRAGNVAGPAWDTIFLDRARPVSLGIAINGGARYTISPHVNLTLSASDVAPASGVDSMQFTDDGTSWTPWEKFGATRAYDLPGPDGTKTVYFRVIDRARNLAEPVSASIILDTTPPAITNVRVSGLSHNSAIISWTTNEDATCGVDYGPTVSYGSSERSTEYLTDHTMRLQGLATSTTYHFRIRATDRAQNPATLSRDYVFITLAAPDTTPPQIRDLSVSGVTDRLAVLGWSTNEPADGTVDWGLDISYGTTLADARFVLVHSFLMTGLRPSTTYHVRAASTDPSGNGPSRSADLSFTTLQAVIGWTTDEPADGTIEYGTTVNYGLSVRLGGLGTRHEGTLGGLMPSTLYHVRVASRDASGNGPSQSEDRTFTTSAVPDRAPPALVDFRIESITTDSATVIWETGELSDGTVEYGPDPTYGQYQAIPGYSIIHRAVLSGLRPDTVIHVRVRSSDPSGNEAVWGDNVFRTLRMPSASDQAPPVISGIQAIGISDTRAVVLWRTDEAANSTVDYGTGVSYLWRASDYQFSEVHSIVLSGLRPSTEYRFRVGSSDLYGNGPSYGPDMRFTTAAGPDNTAPHITAITVTDITNSSAVIQWVTDEPANSLVEYGADTGYGRNRTSVAFVLNHTIQLDGLSNGTVYHFRIVSADPNANAAEPSKDNRFTTKGGPSAPGPDHRPSEVISIGGGGWLLVALAVLVAMALVAAAVFLAKRGAMPARVAPAPPPALPPAPVQALPPPEGPEEEVLQMDPPEAGRPEPVRQAQPLRHVRCSTCGTRIPVFSDIPHRIVCPGCGKSGTYRARI
jgi:predicted GH43/DUF377 family glycosyl hydrolase